MAACGPDADIWGEDLACGTGITSREILAALGPGGPVTGADQSAAMLAVAARAITDSRITWVEAAAENIDRRVTGPVDAVVCACVRHFGGERRVLGTGGARGAPGVSLPCPGVAP